MAVETAMRASQPPPMPKLATGAVEIPLRTPVKTNEAPERMGQLSLGVMSPVNQNGSFEFDRVIKEGEVLKRTRKTKVCRKPHGRNESGVKANSSSLQSWKPVYLVLRPNLISIYRNRDETKLRHQLILSDLTAVARQKDPKGRAEHIFGLFSPSRNFRLACHTEKEAQQWVELIRRQARIDAEEEEMIMSSPNSAHNTRPLGDITNLGSQQAHQGQYTSSEGEEQNGQHHRPRRPEEMHSAQPLRGRAHSHMNPYASNSNTDLGSYSDFSDATGTAGGFIDSSFSLPRSSVGPQDLANILHPDTSNQHQQRSSTSKEYRPLTGNRAVSAPHNIPTKRHPYMNPADSDARILCQGWLHILRSPGSTKGGIRVWRKSWVVLRPSCLAFYKDSDEYSAQLILPFSSIIDAVDVDPSRRSNRKHGMQILTEERNYRLAAADEDSLARWLGGLKSLLVKRKAGQQMEQVHRARAATSPSSGVRETKPLSSL